MADANPTVRLSTTRGDIVLELDRERAPKTTENFLGYARSGHYDGTIFHRVIDGFMVQGGGFDASMQQKPTGEPIENEWGNGIPNAKGAVAMARLGNQPDSATPQFFINVGDNTFLDEPRDGAGYAAFGHVVEGMDVVDEIRRVETHSVAGHDDVPADPITITSATVENG